MRLVGAILRRLSVRHIAIAVLVVAFAVLAVAGVLTRRPGVAGTAHPGAAPSWSCCWAGDTPPQAGSAGVGAPPATATVPTSTPAGVPGGDDGVGDEPSPTTTAAGDSLDAAREVAVEFLRRYLNIEGETAAQWRDSWRQMVTDQEAQLLADADPTRVPPGRVGTPTEVVPLGTGLAAVTVPIVANTDVHKVRYTVKVTLVYDANGFWQVSQLDQGQPS